MKYIILPGRILYSLIFLMTFMNHFSGQTVSYALLSGVPDATVLVPLSGILAIAGALSIILGYKTKWGAFLIIAFLIPVTIYMHAFWQEKDPVQTQIQMAMFMKNVSMLGAAMIIAYFGSGPYSLDKKKREIKKSEIKYKKEEFVNA